MYVMTMNVKRFEKFVDDYARKEIPFATATAINKLLFEGKKGVERDMDKTYKGGATKFSKQGVRYHKATKHLPIGILYIEENRPYVVTTMDGGQVAPKKRVLIKPVNIRLSKQGNIGNKAVAKRYDDPKYFSGKPYRGTAPNSARKSVNNNANDPDVGLWERVGRKGKRGGIARKTIRMIVAFGNTRVQRKFFNARVKARNRFNRTWREVFGKELAKAVAKSKNK